jgi:lysylphosphatidylglycerol synthetase-like protein (DUF2156 family)
VIRRSENRYFAQTVVTVISAFLLIYSCVSDYKPLSLGLSMIVRETAFNVIALILGLYILLYGREFLNKRLFILNLTMCVLSFVLSLLTTISYYAMIIFQF